MGKKVTLPTTVALLRDASRDDLAGLWHRIGHDLRGQAWLVGAIDGSREVEPARRTALAARMGRRTLHVADLCTRLGDACLGFTDLEPVRWSLGHLMVKVDDEHLAVAPSKTPAFEDVTCPEVGVSMDSSMLCLVLVELLPDATTCLSVDVSSGSVMLGLALRRDAAADDLRLCLARALLSDLTRAVGGAFDPGLGLVTLPTIPTL